MKEEHNQTPEPEDCSVDKDIPSCGTGPLGRLTWTIRELLSLIMPKKEA